jgi:hypothetical protein
MAKGAPRQKRKGEKADEMLQAALAGEEEGPSERCSAVQIPMAARLGPSTAFIRAHQVP